MTEFDELLIEVEKIIKAYDSIPDITNLPMYHPVSLPAMAFDRLKNKYMNYKKSEQLPPEIPRGKSPLCICGEINARNCPVHGV